MGAFVHLKYRSQAGLRQAARLLGASGHADEAAEAFTRGDEEDPPEVPAACAKCHSAPGYKDFLGMDGSEAGLALAGGATITAGAGLLNREAKPEPEAAAQADYALIIDTTRCTGCQACVEACRIRNNLPEGQSYIHGMVRGDEHLTWYLMAQCQHCADPPCATVCPTDATYVREDGVVLIDERLCVGCKYCIYACPYDARIYDAERGVADKCWLCLDWVLGGGEPACVQACIPGARIFGRLDDPDSEVRQLIDSGRARQLRPEYGTDPAVLRYIIEDPAA